jgi:hypothetical protein
MVNQIGQIKGAVDLSQCPTPGKCRCGRCLKCGCAKHTAIHGAFLGNPPGSKPFGHEFQSMLR